MYQEAFLKRKCAIDLPFAPRVITEVGEFRLHVGRVYLSFSVGLVLTIESDSQNHHLLTCNTNEYPNGRRFIYVLCIRNPR